MHFVNSEIFQKNVYWKKWAGSNGGLHDWAKVQSFRCFLLIDYNSVILSIRILPLTSMGLLDLILRKKT
jgi:hypothetical protein